MQLYLSVQGVTNLLRLTSQLQHLGDFAADTNEVIPLGFQSFVNIFFLHCRPRQHLYGLGSVGRLLHELPNLFHSEAQHRSQHNNQIHQDFVHCSLCAAAFLAISLVSIQAVLDDIQIVAGHFHGAEVVDCMVQHMEVIAFISCSNLLLQQLQMHQSPFIQLQHFLEGNGILFVVEVVGIAQDIADGVTNLAIYLSQLLQDFRGDTDICLIIGGSSPQTNDISAILLDNILRNDNIAHGFGHLAAFAVNNIAVSQNGFIGSLAGYGNGGQEGGLEPAAMLVAALQVHINRPAQLRTLCSYCHMGGATVKPNVHDIGFLVEMVVTTFRAYSASGQQLFSAMSPPCIGAFLFKPVSNSIDGSFVNQMLAAFVAIEYGNGHAPNTLTADAPVMAVANHVVDALLAPGGNPFYIVSNSLQGVITEAINGCEPLGGCTEDDGVLAAPAVCILVLNVFLAQQAVQLGQVFQNGDIGIEYEHALELLASFSSELALGINGAQDGQLVFQAGFKVDIAVTRSGMYAAGTSFQGYIVS